MRQLTVATVRRMLHAPQSINAWDDLVTVAGVCCIVLAGRVIVASSLAAIPLSLWVLAGLALAVRIYPLLRLAATEGGQAAPAVTASTPLLAIMALYGPAWATVVTPIVVALEQLLRNHHRLDPERWIRASLSSAVIVAVGGVAFSIMGGEGGDFDHIAIALPALSAAQIVLSFTSWLVTIPRHVQEAQQSYREVWRETLLGSLPAIAAEPVLALVLASAAFDPAPATLLAVVLPLMGLILALRLHAEMRARLQSANVDLGRAHDQLRIQATTDVLTGLANRRLFEEMLASRFAEAQRYERDLAVLLLDLDGFKKVNDTYGHAAGDQVLTAVAQALRQGLRASDLPARLAGDEFVALLPETDGRQALALAERICGYIAALRVPVQGGTISLSASIGAASTDSGPVANPAALLALADAAAYTAKAAGKNAARLAGRTGRTTARSAGTSRQQRQSRVS